MLNLTIKSLLNIHKLVEIIVICNYIPEWFKTDKRVTIIIAKNVIFEYLKDLDGGKDINDYENNELNNYIKYLNMNGKYHNKDKGLKYFLGLLYLSKLKKHPEYVALVDGDDYIHNNIYNILNNLSKKYNIFFINKGYILFSNIKELHKIDKFTNICGSNRFFRFKFLDNLLKKRLNLDLNDKIIKNFIKFKRVSDNLINNIFRNINNSPKKWLLLPLLLGKHKSILSKCNIKILDEYVGIKLIHSENHTLPVNIKEMLLRYKSNGICPKESKILNIEKKLLEFNVKI